MNKIIEGAKEALKVAKCDHELVLLKRPGTAILPEFDRYSCNKCLAVLWVPISNGES